MNVFEDRSEQIRDGHDKPLKLLVKWILPKIIVQAGVTRFLVLPLVLCVAFFLIADLDSPRRGVIHVVPQNLISLAESLHGLRL